MSIGGREVALGQDLTYVFLPSSAAKTRYSSAATLEYDISSFFIARKDVLKR
jgi:hypothetical protein